jgi:hydrophobic/amphiphilic exporter-1 (mainly G- bacteria), HAE1 family
MNLIKMSIQQPITIAVGVILAVLAGAMAFLQVPIKMTPEVDSVVISVMTR